MAICSSLGLRVPEDIAILGVDDDEVACELSEVPLSSVAQPLFAIGYEAARVLHPQLGAQGSRPATTARPVTRSSEGEFRPHSLQDEDVVAALRLINEHFIEPINVQWIVRPTPRGPPLAGTAI